jgi:arginine N-succinyltransferase
LVGQIDSLRTVAHAADVALSAVHEKGGDKVLIATGRLADYRCTYGFVFERDDGTLSLDRASVDLLGLEPGQTFTMAERAAERA